jgi:ABC-2 type transport system permease protein
MIAIIIRKELMMLFISPLAWVLLAAIQLILTWFFLIRLDAFLEIQPQMLQIANPPGVTEMIVSPVFALAAIVLMMIAPILSMRLFAEERRNHTLGFLLAAPVSITAIVLGKIFRAHDFFYHHCHLDRVIILVLITGWSTGHGVDRE